MAAAGVFGGAALYLVSCSLDDLVPPLSSSTSFQLLSPSWGMPQDLDEEKGAMAILDGRGE